jgi:hypothetical protein
MMQRIEEGDGKCLSEEERRWLDLQSGGCLRYDLGDTAVMADDEKGRKDSGLENFAKVHIKEVRVNGPDRDETEGAMTKADQSNQSQTIKNANEGSGQEATLKSNPKKDATNKIADLQNTPYPSNPSPTHLTPMRYARLKNAGVAMNKWEKRLLELRQFYAEKGHCNVPIDYPEVSTDCSYNGFCFITQLIG